MRNNISSWTTDNISEDYDVWQLNAAISSYLVAGTPNGNYSAMWNSNYAAAANPPTANPQTNAFRIYLPTDAGTAPAEPYLEQDVTQRVSAVLPVATPVRFTVTVRMVNPTANAITFSAAHLVTANIPGSGVVYGGSAGVGEGAVGF